MSLLPDYKDGAGKIKSTIFYVSEYRDLTLTLFKKYNQAYLSRMFLTDLVEATGMYLRLLEKFVGETGGFLVQKKKKKIKKRKRTEKNKGEINKGDVCNFCG